MLGLTWFPVLALSLHRIAELPSGVRHAAHMHEAITYHGRVVAIIAIGLQITPEPVQQAQGHPGAPTRIIVIQGNRLIRRPTPLQPEVDPESETVA